MISLPSLAWFALVPILHYALLYAISRKRKTLSLLRGNYAITYLDWLFVPFNALIPIATVFSWKRFFLFSFVALLTVLVLHHRWRTMANRPETRYLCVSKKGLTPEGIVHFVFMILQIALVLTVFVSTPISAWYAVLLGLLLAYLAGYVLIIKYVRGLRIVTKPEHPFLIGGIVVVSVRLILAILT